MGRGYVPLDEMVWNWVEFSPEEPEEPIEPGFEAVKPSKHRSKKPFYRNNTPLPPPVPHVNFISSLTITTYHPHLLAERLQLPLGILPLFAALAGNDLYAFDRSFHSSGLNSVQRLERVASTLRDCLNPKSKRTSKGLTSPVTPSSGDTALSLLTDTVNALSSFPLSEDQIDVIIHQLIESALSYALPGSTLQVSTITPSSTAPPSPHRDEILSLYVKAMENGDLSPKIAGCIRDGRYVSKLWLEDTQRVSIARHVGDGIRDSCWALLDEGVGIVFDQTEAVDRVKESERIAEERLRQDEDRTHEQTGLGDVGQGFTDEERIGDSGNLTSPVLDAGLPSDDGELTQDGDEAELATSSASPDGLVDAPEPEPIPTPSIQTYLRSSSLFLPKLVPIVSTQHQLALFQTSTLR